MPSFTRDLEEELHFALQRGLLGNVVPSLRTVVMQVTPARSLIRFRFEALATPADLARVAAVESSVRANFSKAHTVEVETDHRPTDVSPWPSGLENARAVYERYER